MLASHHNTGNALCAQTNEEFKTIFLLPMEADVEGDENAVDHAHSGTVNYPYALDWREKGLVSPVSALCLGMQVDYIIRKIKMTNCL